MSAIGTARLVTAERDELVPLTFNEVFLEGITASHMGLYGPDVVIDDGEFTTTLRYDNGHTVLVADSQFIPDVDEWSGTLTPGEYVRALMERIREREFNRGDVRLVAYTDDPEADEEFCCHYLLHLRSFTLAGAHEEARAMEQELHYGLGGASEG